MEVKDKIVTVESLNYAYQDNSQKITTINNSVDNIKEDIKNIIDSQGKDISSITYDEIMEICQ